MLLNLLTITNIWSVSTQMSVKLKLIQINLKSNDVYMFPMIQNECVLRSV